MIDREIVRERSFAFLLNSPLPRVERSLPRRLRRKPSVRDVEAEDLVTLRFNLQSRVASVHTRNGEVGWNAAVSCQLQINYREASPRPSLDAQFVEKTAFAAALAAASPQEADSLDDLYGRGVPAARGDRGGSGLRQDIVPSGDSITGLRNGDQGETVGAAGNGVLRFQRGSEKTRRNREVSPPDVGAPFGGKINGPMEGQPEFGHVSLGLQEPRAAQPHIILSTDTYSPLIIGHYRLLAETLARWLGTTISMVSEQ